MASSPGRRAGVAWLIMIMFLAEMVGARVVQEVPSEEYYMNYKQVEDCDNPMSDGTCPLLGGPYRLPNIWLQMNGTVFTEGDYTVQSALGYVPPPRAFHATAAFQDLLWITGGRTTPRSTYGTRLSDRLGDVWYSEDGDLWTPVVRLTGDFSVQEADAVQPGAYAPWWARYGHSLTAMDLDGDGRDDLMVLMGGFAPEAMNDVWVTSTDTAACAPSVKLEAKLSRAKMAGDGGCTQRWDFVHYAPWAPRGWHSAAVFRGRLFVLGGSPLNNDVWSANVSNASAPSAGGYENAGGLWFDWRPHHALNASAPAASGASGARAGSPLGMWAPRAGHVAMTQHRPDGGGGGGTQEALYVMGGFAGWPCDERRQFDVERSGCHPLYDGGSRSRNDVWVTYDASNWTLVTAHAPWGSRAWAAGLNWHVPGNKSRDVGSYAQSNGLPPKLWLTGGVYYGTKHRAFAEVTTSAAIALDSRTAYLDLWCSYDGKTWTEVSYRTGVARLGDDFSTAESYLTSVDDVPVYLGKYGHTLTAFKRVTPGMPATPPALFFIGGDRLPQVKQSGDSTEQTAGYAMDVFRTALGSDSDGGRTGMLCNKGATECSGHGTCCHAFENGNVSSGDGNAALQYQVNCADRDWGGCVCEEGFSGEWCEEGEVSAAGPRARGASALAGTFQLLSGRRSGGGGGGGSGSGLPPTLVLLAATTVALAWGGGGGGH